MSDHVAHLREQARALPEAPGVYFWKDFRNSVLYVGKAVNLRSRVTSYFSTAQHDRRTRDLISRSRAIEYELTATELQALFRESALIKQLQPKFNRALKQSHRGFYIKLDAAMTDPYMQTTRVVENDGSLYFGPFRSAAVIRETMEFLHAVLPLRKCTAAKPKCKPCLYFQMHTCAAPALDDLHRQQHREAIDRLHEILDGRNDRVIRWLEAKRDRLSESLLFERAAEVQQRLDTMGALVDRQSILEAAARCRCVLIAESTSDEEGARLLLVAHGSVLSVRGAGGASIEGIVQWLRAHLPLAEVVKLQQSDLDAAIVLDRWLATKRRSVRWTTIPHDCGPEDMRERVCYVVGGYGDDNARPSDRERVMPGATSARPETAVGQDAARD